MAKYNQLTKMLLEKGYDVNQYPSYVKITSGGSLSADLLDNLYGGFEYQTAYIADKAFFITGCGLYAKGENCLQGLSYMGIEWCYENNNPVVLCPFFKYDCEQNHALLRCEKGEEAGLCFCACRRSIDYVYESSIEFARKELEKEQKQLYAEFDEKHNGRICPEHMYYDPKQKVWQFRYEPIKCAKHCHETFCPVRNSTISKKSGNVFYDLQVKRVRKDDTFLAEILLFP